MKCLHTRRRDLLLAVAIPLLVLACYFPALRGGFIWDDLDNVRNNPFMTEPGLEGLGHIWRGFERQYYRHQWYPLTYSVFWLQHRLWGWNTLGYHIVNVLLHSACAILLWRIVRRLGVPGAAWLGVIFALHPVHVQSVAWIIELKNVLSASLMLASLWCFLRAQGIGDERAGGPGWLVAAALLLLLSLLSKTANAILPVVLLGVLWQQGRRVGWRQLLALLPLAMVALFMVTLTVVLEHRYGGAKGEAWSLTAAERIVLAGQALTFYVGKLVWPWPLSMLYPRWEVRAGEVLAWLAPLLWLAVLVAAGWGRRRIGRGPVLALLLFVGTTAPMYAVNVYMMRYTWVTDHWLYWASMPMLALGVGGVATAAARWPRYRRAIGVTAAAYVVLLAGITWMRSHDFASEEALWRSCMARAPQTWLGYNNLAKVLQDQGRLDEAWSRYRQASVLAPQVFQPWSNMGLMRRDQGRYAEATELLEKAAALEPRMKILQLDIGFCHEKAGNLPAAITHYENWLKVRPDDDKIRQRVQRLRNRQDPG